MIKEAKVFLTEDGKEFKTKAGAESHERKLEVQKVLKVLNKSKEEISSDLERVSPRYPVIGSLIKYSGLDWTIWPAHYIKQLINSELFMAPKKETIYVIPSTSWRSSDEVLANEVSDDFADPELHCGELYIVQSVKDSDENTKKVYYQFAKSWEERMLDKLKAGEELDESEIRELVFESKVEYETEGEAGRWSKYKMTVINLLDELYAIEWEEGLTENQEHEFYNQPYPVKLETKEVIIKTTEITVVSLEKPKSKEAIPVAE